MILFLGENNISNVITYKFPTSSMVKCELYSWIAYRTIFSQGYYWKKKKKKLCCFYAEGVKMLCTSVALQEHKPPGAILCDG